MSILLASFANELEKLGGVASSLVTGPAKWIGRNPMNALGIAAVAVPTIMAAREGYAGGLHGSEEGRYLSAGPDRSGRIRASDAAYTNFHELLKHKASPKAVAALSKNYNPKTLHGE